MSWRFQEDFFGWFRCVSSISIYLHSQTHSQKPNPTYIYTESRNQRQSRIPSTHPSPTAEKYIAKAYLCCISEKKWEVLVGGEGGGGIIRGMDGWMDGWMRLTRNECLNLLSRLVLDIIILDFGLEDVEKALSKSLKNSWDIIFGGKGGQSRAEGSFFILI